MTTLDQHHSMYGKSRLLAQYHRHVLRKAVKLADVKPWMTVLDYGCGGKELRRFLPDNTDYVGYDLNPALSMIADPSSLKPDVVFAVQVLHCLGYGELCAVVEAFSKITKKVVVMVPSVNSLKCILDGWLGVRERNAALFRSVPWEVERIMRTRFTKTATSRIYPVAELTIWERK